MNNSTKWAVFLALVLTTVLGFFLGKVSEPDLPRCAEGIMLEGIGEWSEWTVGRYQWYQCAATPVDFD